MNKIVLLILLLIPVTVHAHKIRVFAYGEGDVIKGETSFHGGKAARNVSIIVTDTKTSETLLTTNTNEKGEFSFPISDNMKNDQTDLLIVASAGEGHRNEWLLAAADYLPDIKMLPASPPPVEEKVDKQIPAAVQNPGIDEQALKKIVQEAVAEQLSPLKRMLLENSERKVSLQDILGGLGYIIGLAGLAAFMKNRKENAS